jgi:hypothetical protein
MLYSAQHLYNFSYYADAHHRFIAEESDWGFTRFSELRKLMTPQNEVRPTIEDDAAEISVFVRVLEDPTGVLWHNFVKLVLVSGRNVGWFTDISSYTQLRLQEGDRLRWFEEPGSNMLHELSVTIIVLYPIFPKSKCVCVSEG